jgi:hypothetical protein
LQSGYLQLPAFNGKVTRFGSTCTKHYSVKFLEQVFRRKVFANLGVAQELHALFFKDFETAQDDLFLIQLHVGDTIHEQPTGAIGAFKHGDPMTSLVELRGGAKTGRAGTDDGDFFTRALGGGFGRDPTFVPASVCDRTFDVLDCDWRIGDTEYTRAFAGCRADATGELREVIGLV